MFSFNYLNWFIQFIINKFNIEEFSIKNLNYIIRKFDFLEDIFFKFLPYIRKY